MGDRTADENPSTPADKPVGTPLVSPSSYTALNQSPEAKSSALKAVTASSIVPGDDASTYERKIFQDFMAIKRSTELNPPPPDPMRVGESCASKLFLSTVIGGGMGVVVGVVFGAMGGMQAGQVLLPGVPEPPRKTFRHEMRDSWRQTKFKSRSWAKNFAYISGVFSGVECVVEKIRGKHDVLNSVGAGCITGAGLAMSQGPQAMCLGCLGFAAFSYGIDIFMGGH